MVPTISDEASYVSGLRMVALAGDESVSEGTHDTDMVSNRRKQQQHVRRWFWDCDGQWSYRGPLVQLWQTQKRAEEGQSTETAGFGTQIP
ncbi:MAG TPA: hypothetical protein VJZ70_05205 [Limnochordia bacterium]|nr:hypothetical protein [Limnochordia bacterium]